METLRVLIAIFISLASLMSLRTYADEQTPYGGTPFRIPGSIPAYFFDNGGEGVAYHDADAGNRGGLGRATDVDLDSRGYHYAYVGWTEAGEWLEYTVNVQQSGNYIVEAIVASDGQGGAFHIELDGVDRTGPIVVPNTGDWRNFVAIAKTEIHLDAGMRVMRIALDSIGSSGSVGNIMAVNLVPSVTSIPGIVEAERFKDGEGIGYHDTGAGNNGNRYRSTDVDIDFPQWYSFDLDQAATGHYVGWTQAGEWLTYDIDVQVSGYYALGATVMSDGQGGTFHIEFDGVDKTGPIAVPSTGGWQMPEDISVGRIYLNAGLQSMRIVMDTNGASGSVGNLDRIKLFFAERVPRYVAIPGTVQAEYFDGGGEGIAYHDTDVGNNGTGGFHNVDTDFDVDTGTTYVGWTRAGEWIEYTVQVQTAGYYMLDTMVASDSEGGTFHVEFDGIDKTGSIPVPNTQGWRMWQIVRAPSRIYLAAGSHVMRLAMDSVGPSGSVANFDWLRLTPRSTVPGIIEAEAFNDGSEGVAYHDTDTGNNGHCCRGTDVDLDVYSLDNRLVSYVGWTQAGEWLAYTVDVLTAGYYRVEAQVASQGVGGTFHIELNGVDITGPLSVPDTGDWRNWQGVAKSNIYLMPSIDATLRIVLDSTGPSGSVGNIDFISFSQ